MKNPSKPESGKEKLKQGWHWFKCCGCGDIQRRFHPLAEQRLEKAIEAHLELASMFARASGRLYVAESLLKDANVILDADGNTKWLKKHEAYQQEIRRSNEIGCKVPCGEVLGFQLGTKEHGIAGGLCLDCFRQTLKNSGLNDAEIKKYTENFKRNEAA